MLGLSRSRQASPITFESQSSPPLITAAGSLQSEFGRDPAHDPHCDFASPNYVPAVTIHLELGVGGRADESLWNAFGRATGGSGDDNFGSVAQANPSTITSVDIADVQPVGSYAGLSFRYIEGALHGEVSAAEPIAGLRGLAGGRTTVPYQVSFHIVAPEAASDADTVVVEAPNAGGRSFLRRSAFPLR
jgi:hypothetical protein